ncbi:hypothetical protein VTL71DRAFT_11272 [Oculimacula yallundae]|uniref:Thioester reductase (TE) domain-containing protein n=1 Tax=Oculimacula yallundae TaxID=86028 RepID=A0ABR4CVI2_9HELO
MNAGCVFVSKGYAKYILISDDPARLDHIWGSSDGLYHILPFDARTKLTAIPATLSQQDLGLSPAVYRKMCSEVTGVIHCACPQEWVQLLRNSNQDPIINPPIKLLDFFASKHDDDKPRTGLVYDTSYARLLSSSLAAAPKLDQQLVNMFAQRSKVTS